MKKFTLLLSLLFALVSIQAQDYLINFAGTGASTTIGTVTVEDLTQGKSISLSGSEVLHLLGTYTGVNTIPDNDNALRIYPNPTTDYSTIEFVSTATGTANIELFDITGKRVVASQNTLIIGNHSYKVSGLRSGIYSVRILSPAYIYTGKLISNGAPNSDVKLSYLGNSAIPVTSKMLKSASAEKTMQYITGDRLKFTAASGNYSTLMTDIPTQSKTLTFTFVPCTDADGNNYPVVQIGTQVWMVGNLKTTKYRNGDIIGTTTPATLDITGQSMPKYQWAYAGNESRVATYGRLYTWYALTDSRGICPLGWHVPSDAEWTTLTSYLGGESVAGNKLKETGTSHWPYPGTAATNETGFTALPGGDRYFEGDFYEINKVGYWWSSTEIVDNSANAWVRGIYNNEISRLDDSYKAWGMSVRCLSDVSTAAVIPDIYTTYVYDITASTATCGGRIITNNGGATVTTKGVCWSIDQTPTIADSKTIDDTGFERFTSKMTGLSPNTKYYLRAYVTNSEGTGYGNELSFKTGETVTDIEGNVYNTITIGTQVWMIENLKATKYNDGTSIPNVTNNTAWGNLTTPGYCWYNNDVSNKNLYGALYNWYAVNTNKLAPQGWHVPTDAEWTTLTTFLGGESIAGGKLKETGTSHWQSPNTGATNEPGFTALPGGYRSYVVTFYNICSYGGWWSSTEDDTIYAWFRSLYSDYSDAYRNGGDKSCGFSVRCVRDF